MRRIFSFFVVILVCILPTITLAAEGSTCVLIKFSNDTRYKEIETEVLLSELVVEKLLESGKFNIVETKPINEDIEALLYDVKAREIENLKRGINKGNFNDLFEGPGFDPTQAESMATASVGQIVTPAITSKIGKDNNAEYLIQGTIINLGTGEWTEHLESQISSVISSAILKSVGIFDRNDARESILNSGKTSSAIALQADLRIIKASTGEVIWNKQVGAFSGKSVEGKEASLEKLKLESEMYASLMENAANQIVKLIIKDSEEGKLFVK